MIKVTLADGTVVWVDGTWLEEVQEVLQGCGALSLEEQDPHMHATPGAELFDLSGTQVDFKGKTRLRLFALERFVVALRAAADRTTEPTRKFVHEP